MLIHQLPFNAAFATLRGRPEGLSATEAASRRLEFGRNHDGVLIARPNDDPRAALGRS